MSQDSVTCGTLKTLQTMTEQKGTKKEGAFLVVGMFLGLALGAILGVVTGKVGVWLPIGLALGTMMGVLLGASKRKQ